MKIFVKAESSEEKENSRFVSSTFLRYPDNGALVRGILSETEVGGHIEAPLQQSGWKLRKLRKRRRRGIFESALWARGISPGTSILSHTFFHPWWRMIRIRAPRDFKRDPSQYKSFFNYGNMSFIFCKLKKHQKTWFSSFASLKKFKKHEFNFLQKLQKHEFNFV